MVLSKSGGFLAVCALLFAVGTAATASAQAPAVTLASLAGAWEGVAQSPNGEVALQAEFKVQDGKLGGVIQSSLGVIPIVSASLAEDKLTMTIDFQGASGTLVGKVLAARIEGTWEVGGSNGTFALARAGAAGGGAASGDPISGAWAGEVQIAGQVMPFSMLLRLAGETVTGEVTSAVGAVPLSASSWKDGTLQLAFPYTSGEPVSMSARLENGKLVGAVDYNRGEATGTWSASRKQ